MSDSVLISRRRILLFVLLFTILVRVLTLGAYPLTDTTEARYAEISRKMVETGNWVTPQEDYGVPFWAKPPLSTWLTACCFKLFGVNEFTARLSSLVLALVFGWLTYYLAVRQRDRDYALLGIVIFATAGLTFITAGAVMTDGAVVLSTTLCMVAFWRAMYGQGRVWGYLFFAGLAAGILSKGLVPIVLTLFPIGLWVLWKNQWNLAWRRLPWLSGTLLFLALAVPWYALAEIRTPGFLKYFFIGEHLGKFADSGWKGDMYGTAHGHTRGMIWVYWVAAALPWSLALPGVLLRRKLRPAPSDRQVPMDEWTSYLIAWSAAPMLFFTFAGNIMLTYVMPGLPAFALLCAEFLSPARMREKEEPASKRRLWQPLVALSTPLLVIAVIVTVGPKFAGNRSQYAMVKQYKAIRTDAASKLVYIWGRPHSAQFYTSGKAEQAGPETLEKYFHEPTQDYFVVKDCYLASWELKPALDRMEPVWKFGEYNLMQKRKGSF